jgi:RND family efflux transporter MFP subunit
MRPHPAALLLLSLPLLAACQAEPPAAAAPAPPRPVQVVEVRPSAAEQSSAHTGVVRARHEVDLGFRAAGRIATRLVELGEWVEPGQPLATIDPADLTLALRAAEAELAAAEASARQAANDAARSRALLAAGHVAAAFDDQRQASARSTAERAAAARAQLELARNRLAYTTLLAPHRGVVTALLAEAGQVVPEGQAVLRLADPAERELLVRVPESALPDLARAQAEARFWARPDQPQRATLREVAPQADTQLRTYAVRFALPEAPDWIALGMTGTVRLSTPASSAATLPLSALHDRGEGPMVWRLLPEGRVEAVPVRVLTLGAQTVAVSGGLAMGDQVVSLGPQLLDPQSRVRVVQTRLAATLR